MGSENSISFEVLITSNNIWFKAEKEKNKKKPEDSPLPAISLSTKYNTYLYIDLVVSVSLNN